MSEKVNNKTKSFGALPDIYQKNPRMKSTIANLSTMNSTNNNKNTYYNGNNQNSTLFLDNGTKENFKNKNTFFNNTNNNYNKFLGSSINIPNSNKEKKLDITEINDSLDKTVIMIKDMNNSILYFLFNSIIKINNNLINF